MQRKLKKDRRYYELSSAVNPSTASGLGENIISVFVNQEADAALEEEENEAKKNVAAPNAADAATAFMASRNQRAPPSPMSNVSDHGADDGERGTSLPEEFTSSEQVEISELLDAWEEPTKAEESEVSLLVWLVGGGCLHSFIYFF